jgi:hypothetical protein
MDQNLVSFGLPEVCSESFVSVDSMNFERAFGVSKSSSVIEESDSFGRCQAISIPRELRREGREKGKEKEEREAEVISFREAKTPGY